MEPVSSSAAEHCKLTLCLNGLRMSHQIYNNDFSLFLFRGITLQAESKKEYEEVRRVPGATVFVSLV